MSDDPNKTLSDAEAKALRSLAGDVDPSPAMEDRLVAELKRRGAIRANGGWIMKISKTAAAAIIVGAAFLGGFVMGNHGAKASKPVEIAATTPATDEHEFMLLMFSRADATENDAEMDPQEYRAIVDEYRQWAIDREKEGRLVSAEKLADETRVMTESGDQVSIATSADTNRVLGGYFLITAPNLDDAIALAKTHPHLKYGGEVEVRPIENTR